MSSQEPDVECQSKSCETSQPYIKAMIERASKARRPQAVDLGKCPLNRDEVGRAGWGLLHTMAVNYPEKPTTLQQSQMNQFMHLFAEFYPCKYCANRMKQELHVNPPRTGDRRALMYWMCSLHNEVNERMGKDMFDCDKYEERWKTGPPDGSCN